MAWALLVASQACRELREMKPRGHTPSLPHPNFTACSQQVWVPLRHALLPRSNPGGQQREEQDRAAITQQQAALAFTCQAQTHLHTHPKQNMQDSLSPQLVLLSTLSYKKPSPFPFPQTLASLPLLPLCPLVWAFRLLGLSLKSFSHPAAECLHTWPCALS